MYDKRKSDYGGRLLIFSSDEQLRVLLQSDVLFADGTFRVAPKLFEQLYVIHGFQHGECKDFFLHRLYISVHVIQGKNKQENEKEKFIIRQIIM